ncbi:Transcriptional coactivator HFI1/ADA1 [Candida viswanathii]|uniref:Transcriptional coactivator HFI1/ADA1 n=1 Tax=Candida viswanathii TaxID=5486 RepID=A0A367XUQ0_9ASCO|nr:Transcriptional coactivator HFI1/ADA1 [Candida viswanathii]
MTSQVTTTSSTATSTMNTLNKNGTSSTAVTTQPSTATGQPQKKTKSFKRLEMEKLIREFQTKLGKNWEKYHETLSLFLIGKLSRQELISIIIPILKEKKLLKYHNKLLLLNFANSLKDNPLELSNEFSNFFNKKSGKISKNKNNQFEKFKSIIMGLPVKERKRIIDISRDSGKRNKLVTDIILTRHSILPKIPMIQDKEQQQLQVNNLVQWQQDVLNGINTPIATESYEIPDYDNLSRQMLMTMREYGLTGGLNPGVMEVLLLGLEAHLKNIVETAIDVAKFRKNKYTNDGYVPLDKNAANNNNTTSNNAHGKGEIEEGLSNKDITLCVEDMYDTFEMYPHLIEPNGPKLRLSNVMLENDDMISDGKGLDYELPPKSIEYIAKETAAAAASSTANTSSPQKKDNSNSSVIPRPDAHIGSTDELKWVLHDLVSTM